MSYILLYVALIFKVFDHFPMVNSAPNIVFIVADDLGWNDISLHGSPQIPTPNIDAIAKDGVVFDNYYVMPDCSPSRSSFLTGRHAIHTGVFRAYNYRSRNGHLNTSYTLLPQYLKSCCNYSTHIVGKWHLGLSTLSTLPTYRGFDTHLGYWFGMQDHQRHRSYTAYDFHNQLELATQYNNTFSTPIFAEEATKIIENSVHNENPFFLYLAFQDIHWPLQAPEEYISRFEGQTNGDLKRQVVCAMAAHLDEAIGNVTAAITRANIWDNTLLIFTSDNGGPTNGDEVTSSNNFPLRGGKNTLWEGGTRVPLMVKGAGVAKTNYINQQKIFATDWLPTLVSMASGTKWTEFVPQDEPPYLYGDGVDQWSTISRGATSSRDYILLETHPSDADDRYHGDALIVNDWKIIKIIESANNKIQNGWFPPPGQNPADIAYTVKCALPSNSHYRANPYQCLETWCLFNITSDPCEYENLALEYPNILHDMLERLEAFQSTAVYSGVEGCFPLYVPLPDGSGHEWKPCDM